MVIGENTKWVIAEIAEVDGQMTLFMSPNTLRLEPGFVGDIIWYVFTPGWALTSHGIQFPAGSAFDGQPQPDPNRPGCWSTAAANTAAGLFPYTLQVRHAITGGTLTFDPAVENEAPPPTVAVNTSRSRSAGRLATASN